MIKHQDGIVIVAVLWICALIMWLSLQIGAETRLQADERVHLLRQTQALYLATGGAFEALARMGEPISLEREDDTENASWQPDGTIHEVAYRTGRAIVTIQKETDKVNVNEATQEQIKAVLEKIGLEDDQADTLADFIADFVDPDDTPRLNGAEEDYYKNEGLRYVPFNNKLTSIDQLLLVPGITQQLFYGFDLGAGEAEAEGESSEYPLLTGKDSLFQMFTIYGNNVSFEDEEILEQAKGEMDYVTWEANGTYRILSCGKLSSGSPSVTLWLIVRYTPESESGYEVLYRKIL